jgi:superfamily II DNA or RNA helicase
MIKLRSYQRHILEQVRRSLLGMPRASGEDRLDRPAVAAATGSGKTVMFSHLVLDDHWTEGRVSPQGRRLILVHRDELVNQARGTLLGVDPAARDRIGIVKAERDEHDAEIVIASVDTLRSEERRRRITDVGLIIADEAHHAVAPTWRTALGHYGAWEGTPAVGWSATLSRADGGKLGDIWQEVVAKYSIIDGIRAGSLVDAEGLRVHVQAYDTSLIKVSRGDLGTGATGGALHDADAPAAVARAYSEHARREDGTPRPGVVFTPTVAIAQETADALTDIGIPAEMLSGSTPTDERAEIYERYRLGRTVVLCNAMVLTEGWDAPWAEVAVIMRVTRSASLYTQMVGRVLRPWPGKEKALVIDVVGATNDNRLATLVDLAITTKVDEDVRERLNTDEGVSLSGIADTLDDSPVRDGEIKTTSVDLFQASRAMWLTTDGGTMFVPSGNWILFLWPTGEGTYSLGRIANIPRRTRARQIPEYADLPLEFALQHLEELAIRNDPTVSNKSSPWRRNPTVSPEQRKYASSLGIELPADATRASASDAISVRVASLALD